MCVCVCEKVSCDKNVQESDAVGRACACATRACERLAVLNESVCVRERQRLVTRMSERVKILRQEC